MRAKKTTALIALGVAVALSVSACSSSKKGGSSGNGGNSKPSGQLIYGEGSDFPENFFPLIAAGDVTSVANITGRVLDGVFRIAPDVSYQLDPDQASSATSNIVNGQQSMTVFKNVQLEAQAAAQLAIALMQGKSPDAAGLTVAPFSDPKAPGHNLQALLLPAQVITQANVKDVVTAGSLTVAQICAGITSACSALGLN